MMTLNFDQSSLGAFLKEKLSHYEPQMVSYDYGTVIGCADEYRADFGPVQGQIWRAARI